MISVGDAGFLSPARFSHHQFAIQQDVAPGHFRRSDSLQHRPNRSHPNFAARLMNSRQRYRQKGGILNIVDADDPHLFRNSKIQLDQRVHDLTCSSIVGTNDGLWFQRFHHAPKVSCTVAG